jgi:hypothetical protein
MGPAVRRFVLTAHVTSAVGWLGAVLAYLALAVVALTGSDAHTVRGVWLAMELIGWWVLVPLAVVSLLIGMVNALGTPWGLFRHYWVLLKLVLTTVATVILLLHMPTVSDIADVAAKADGANLRGLPSEVVHPAGGLLLLLLAAVLGVYKPKGMTRYGWRKRYEQRTVPPP